MGPTSTLELAEIADSTSPAPERAREMLDRLRRLAPFDAAWLDGYLRDAASLKVNLGTSFRA